MYIERESVHLGELIWGTTSDLGDAKERKFCFQILQLIQKVCFCFLPELVNLDSSFCIQKLNDSD